MEVYLEDLLLAQRARGKDARALVHGDPLDDDPPWLARVPVAATLLFTPLAPGFWGALKRQLREFRPDVLHIHFPNPSAFWLLLMKEARQVPWVLHWHADVVPSSLKGRIAWAYRVYRPFEQAMLEATDQVIVTSPDYLQASEPLSAWHDKCSVVPLGIDRSRLVATTHSAEQVWRDGSFRVLSIGRLTYYKGFETLMQAVADVPGMHLVIIGGGEDRAALEVLQRRIQHANGGMITLLGEVSDADKIALLASCDLFALASRERTEAFGIAALEAMYFSRPCLVSELHGSGLPWVVRSAAAGETVPVDDVPAWRAALLRWRDDVEARRQAGARGAQAIRLRFDVQATTDGVTRVYRRVGVEVAARRHVEPLIVIPARDEAETIAKVIAALQAGGWRHILVIDDQSEDSTGELARAAGARVLRPALPLGAWGAMQAGIRYALRNGFQQVITIDADGQHEPASIPDLVEAARRADVVIGAYPERASRARQAVWSFFRTLTGFRVEDLTSGFRCYNHEACQLLARKEATLLEYQDVGVLLMLRQAGLRVVEVPVAMYPRQAGESKVFTNGFKIARYLLESSLLCLSRWRFGQYSRRR